MDPLANFAYTLVATAPSPADSGTSLVVDDGSVLPLPPPFNVVIWPAGAQPVASNSEIATVTAVSVHTLTITRTQEFVGPRSVIVGDQLAAMVTRKDLEDLHGEPCVPIWDSQLAANSCAIVLEEYIMDGTHELFFGDPSELSVQL